MSEPLQESKRSAAVPAESEAKTAPVALESKAARDVPPERYAVSKLETMREPEDVDELPLAEISRAKQDMQLAHAILHDVFKQSWHEMKHELVEQPDAARKPKREELARGLIEYRNWSYPRVLEQAGKAVNDEQKSTSAYTGIKNKGSTELTSDVDLMLQGDATELVVAKFNEYFKRGVGTGHTWDYEPGIVIDVNAYEKGYVTDPDKATKTRDPSGRQAEITIPIRQGARDVRPEGGVSARDQIEKDRDSQTQAAMLKLRLYMTGKEWDAYANSVASVDPGTIATLEGGHALFVRHYEALASRMLDTETRFVREDPRVQALAGQQLLQQIAEGVAGVAAPAPLAAPQGEQKADRQPKVKLEHLADADPTEAANVLMAASNREAEQLLEHELLPRRMDVERLIHEQNALVRSGVPNAAVLNQIAALERQINTGLVELRAIAARVQAFANEAYLTDAGLHHAVVGLQSGQKIQLTRSEAIQVVTENMGDALKELARYGEDDEALYKSGKYMLRLADAAANAGYGYIGAVQILYDVGRQASVVIKGSTEEGKTQAGRTREYAAADEPLRTLAGVPEAKRAAPRMPSVAELRKAVIDAGRDVQAEYYEQRNAGSQLVRTEEDAAAFASRRHKVAETHGRATPSKKEHAEMKRGEQGVFRSTEPLEDAPPTPLPRERKR